MSPLVNAISFLVNIFLNIFIGLLLLRLILQLIRADFYNPISQVIVKLTNPLLVPLRRVIPGIAGIDVAAIVLLLLSQFIGLLILVILHGAAIQLTLGFFLGMSLWSIGEIFSAAISIYTFGTILLVIFSWIPTHGYNPMLNLIGTLINPFLTRMRSKIPPIAGLDLTPFVFLILLQLVMLLVVNPMVGFGKYLMVV